LQHLVTNKWYIYGNGQISKRFWLKINDFFDYRLEKQNSE
jgi:hypothetical protein